eukprot:COSAG01_NODE_1690_length_9443_cov_19.011078_12_plen_69_part_00
MSSLQVSHFPIVSCNCEPPLQFTGVRLFPSQICQNFPLLLTIDCRAPFVCRGGVIMIADLIFEDHPPP